MNLLVIPAKAGIQQSQKLVPAFAGMTMLLRPLVATADSNLPPAYWSNRQLPDPRRKRAPTL